MPSRRTTRMRLSWPRCAWSPWQLDSFHRGHYYNGVCNVRFRRAPDPPSIMKSHLAFGDLRFIPCVVQSCVDVFKRASEAYESKTPGPVLSDAGKVIPRPGEIDLLVGGPPCQGFSGMNRCV
jgi:hypothetical protein